MVRLDKSEKNTLLNEFKVEREKRQQALNHKQAQVRLLTKEIGAIQKSISDLDGAINYLEGLQG